MTTENPGFTRQIGHSTATIGDHEPIPADTKSARKLQGRFPKGDVRHWAHRVKKDPSGHFFAQIAFRGQRHRFTWETSNVQVAARKAQQVYHSLVANGWEATLAKHKPETAKHVRAATVGEVIAEVGATAGFRHSTFMAYAQSLRQIAAEIANIGDQPALDETGQPKRDRKGRITYLSRRDHLAGGNAAWLEKVNSLSLDILTPEAVQRWRLAYVARAGTAPDTRRRAENTATSLIRNARALFSERALEFAKAKLLIPDPPPFAGIRLPKRGNSKYQSKINAEELIAAANAELSGAPFQIFTLGMLCGLRKAEIDLLAWEQVDFSNSKIRIERTKWFEPKSEDSIATVDVDQELMALLRGWKAQSVGPFVIESTEMPRPGAAAGTYRIEDQFKILYAWLRSKGVTAAKPLHELRKELGALLASNEGIFAAATVLRHAQISTTAEYYADKKRTITAGLGRLLTTQSGATVAKGDFKTPKSRVETDFATKKRVEGAKDRVHESA